MLQRVTCYLVLLAAFATAQISLLEPQPYVGPRLPPTMHAANLTDGLSHGWSQEPSKEEVGNSTIQPASHAQRRSLLQRVAGSCKITVRNACSTTRYFLIAYRTTKNGKNGMFSEGWFNVLPGRSAVVPTQIKTQEPLAARQWFIRMGDGIKFAKTSVALETARCIDTSKPFQFFSEGTAKLACRYDGTYKGKCSSCAALGGVPGHGFYVIAPRLCKGNWVYTFSAAHKNC